MDFDGKIYEGLNVPLAVKTVLAKMGFKQYNNN
jgi:hypothetical protein